MDFAHYQQESRKTAMYPGSGELQGLTYCVLGLAGEAGEVSQKLSKVLRDANCGLTPERRTAMLDEMGDVCWFLANAITELGGDFSAVAQGNLDKLFSRKERGVIQGSGDVR